MNTRDFLKHLRETHATIFGASGVGKSAFLQILAEAIAKNPLEAFTFVCPHGTARALAERIANPANGCHGRIVHVLDPSSPMVFCINAFETHDDTWEAAHHASLLWTSSVASLYATAMHETPRLERILYVLGMFAAHKKLTLLELLEALTLGAGERVREFLLTDFDNHTVRRELEDLHFLASRQPGRFLELTESARNRLVRWLGDKRLARIFGRPKGLDARKVMDSREIVLVDLSPLAQDDANFVSTLLVCRYFAAAKTRTPNLSARHHLIIDEAAGSLCTATAQLLDQTRKFGLLGIFSLQRIGQLREKGEFITDALMVNAGVKIVFGIPEPMTARYLAEQLFTGHINLAEWKPGTERPVAVGNEKTTLRSRSHGRHHAEHVTASHADIRTQARASAYTTSSMVASAAASASGSNASFASTPDLFPFEGPSPLSQSVGSNHSRSSARTNARGTGRSFAEQSARGRADAIGRGSSDALSTSEGEAEAYVTRYEILPTQTYTLEEHLHRLSGEIMNLAPRECFVKVPAQAPIRTRTPDLAPAWKSIEFRSQMLPLYLDNAARNSPYLVPAAQVDAEIAARIEHISRPPADDHDFTAPDPTPTILEQQAYARDFHKRRGNAKPITPPKTNKTKPDRFRVIDGGIEDGDKQP